MATTMLTAGSAAARAAARAAALPHILALYRAPSELPTAAKAATDLMALAAIKRLEKTAHQPVAARLAVRPFHSEPACLEREAEERLAALAVAQPAPRPELHKFSVVFRTLDAKINVPFALRQLVCVTLQLDGSSTTDRRLVKKRAIAAWERVQSAKRVPAEADGMTAIQVGECLRRGLPLQVRASKGPISNERVRADIAKIPDLEDEEERKQATKIVAICDAIKQVAEVGDSAAAPSPAVAPALQ